MSPHSIEVFMPEDLSKLTPREIMSNIMDMGISFDMIVVRLGDRISERSLRRWKAGVKPQRPTDIKALQDLYKEFLSAANEN